MRSAQEDLLVIEALVEYHSDRKDVQPERAARAWVMAKELAAEHGLEVKDALQQRTRLRSTVVKE